MSSLVVEYDETGGYDCMTAAFHIYDGCRLLVDVDLDNFGQEHSMPPSAEQIEEARNVARAVCKALAEIGYGHGNP